MRKRKPARAGRQSTVPATQLEVKPAPHQIQHRHEVETVTPRQVQTLWRSV
jgi:hypothetical protein